MLNATFRLDPEAVALQETFRRLPDLVVDVERIAAHATESTMPCVWASGVDFEALDDALAADASVAEVIEDSEFPDEKYYRIDWSEGVERRVNAFIDHEASVLRAEADADGWRLGFRFVTREQFDAFREFLSERDYAFDLLDLAESDRHRNRYGGLTPTQCEALEIASERGYFEVPREVTTRDLAAELEVSHQALSELLRRATGNLVDSTVAADVDPATGRDPSDRT
jgi:predicted DNA binding protein